ncbi:hypothetical protein [Pseudoxanthomonas kaohsiungensis]|uniref:Uncharacterized protein n=1 Tax=Pseudoxanthomonas kaohsiungensis TaxID=283923 RepID=A0ABW3LXA8_9GAMM|nr:hypothetical protein [Pseudoxanthomonas kaohsiungensis]KAF1703000.1 hypothetical protein CSC66_09510 [Pseudoxanthomonas kaohsiungensis]
MGYGVYSDTFNGTGGTFLVSGTLCTDEDYQAYVADFDTSDGDTPMNYETWCHVEAQDEYSNLLEAIRQAGEDLGLEVNREDFRDARAGFDSEFRSLIEAGPVQLGLRGWQHDYVVGAGAVKDSRGYDSPNDMVAEPDSYVQDQLKEGRVASEYAERAKRLSEDLQAYVRLELQENGFECRYRTSGYTSDRYTPPDNAAALRIELQDRIKADAAYFNLSAEVAWTQLLSTEDGRKRAAKAVLSLLDDDENYGETKVWVPVYYPEQKNVAFFDAFELSRFPEDAICYLNADMPEEMLATFDPKEDWDESTIYHIPRNKHTATWFAEQQARLDSARRDNSVAILSADEFKSAIGVDIPKRLDEEPTHGERPGP